MWFILLLTIFIFSFSYGERIIVKPKDGTYVKTSGFKIKKHIDRAGIYVIEVSEDEVYEVLEKLRKDPSVEYAVRDFIIKAQTICPLPQDQWWMNMINLAGAKSLCNSSNPVTVAVIDTGVDYNHEDLQGRIWKNAGEVCGNGKDDDNNGFIDDCVGYDFVNDDGNPADDNGHGTHIAGIISAVEDSNDNVEGINPDAKIMVIKVLDSQGMGYVSDLIEGIYYAVDNGAKIINLSLGSEISFVCDDINMLLKPLEEAFLYAQSRGVLIISAAGNENLNLDNTLYIPASIRTDNHIVVGAVNPSIERASYSNYGIKTVDVGAPGGDVGTGNSSEICSLAPNNGEALMVGTSIAVPFVSGIASLIYSCTNETNFRRIKAGILLSAWTNRVPSLQGVFMTEGVVNANDSLNLFNKPAIFSIEPYIASPGTLIRIKGVNFGSPGSVYIDGVPVTHQSWTDTLIEVKIPTNINVDPNNPLKPVEVEDSNLVRSNRYLLQVYSNNVSPRVRLCADNLSGPAPLEVTVKAFANDPDGYIVDYRWNIPGSVTYKVNKDTEKVIVFDEPGTYTISVTVVDNKNGEASDKIGVLVTYGSAYEGGKGCFIASAVYGEDSLLTGILRDLRDTILLKFELGRKFVELYYKYSPPVAEFLKANPLLSYVTFLILLPLVAFSWFMLYVPLVFKFMLLFAFILLYYLRYEKK